jgi:hypothetical protein
MYMYLRAACLSSYGTVTQDSTQLKQRVPVLSVVVCQVLSL